MKTRQSYLNNPWLSALAVLSLCAFHPIAGYSQTSSAIQPADNLRVLPAVVTNETDLGMLDETPFPIILDDQVDDATPVKIYTFTLQSQCDFKVTLSKLSTNVNLHLEDSNGNIIGTSTNPYNLKEKIALPLAPGTYSINVKQAHVGPITYQLAASAVFIPAEAIVSGDQDMQDAEYDFIGHQVAWRDDRGFLFVAPVDPVTGYFGLGKIQLVDYNLALYNDVPNGPEWAYCLGGSRIVYTKIIHGIHYIGEALQQNNRWQPILLSNTQYGFKATPSQNPTDKSPLVRYLTGSSTSQIDGLGWSDLSHPSIKGTYDGEAETKSGRWMPGLRSVAISILVQGVYQIAQWDIDTNVVTQLTTGPDQKLLPFIVRAPEYNNELIITTSETDDKDVSFYKWTGIYREINGVWTRIKRIASPNREELPAVQSGEPFIFAGQTYLSFLITPAVGRGEQGRKNTAQVWFSSIHPDSDFTRKVSGVEQGIVRSDPEPFSTEDGAFIYYAEILGGKRYVHRCLTGLPVQSPN